MQPRHVFHHHIALVFYQNDILLGDRLVATRNINEGANKQGSSCRAEEEDGVQKERTYHQCFEIHLVINIPPLSTGVHPSSGVKGNPRPGASQELHAGFQDHLADMSWRQAQIQIKETGLWEKAGLRLPADLRSPFRKY